MKRLREFDPHSVLLIFDNLVEPTIRRLWCSGNPSACHAENVSSILTRRSSIIRVWESLARCCRLGARASGARDRRFKSDHPDCYETYSGGSCVGTGRRLLIAQTQVRFLLPELFRSGNCEVRSLKFRTSNLSLQTSSVPLAERQRYWTSNPVRSVRLRHGTLEQAVGYRFFGCRRMASERCLQSKPLQPIAY